MMTALINCDVLVAGGGSAGMAAAVSAAKSGARTLLVERYGFLGGMGTAALVHTLCGLYLIREEQGAVFANPGFASQFAQRLQSMKGAHEAVRMGRLDVLPHDPWAMAVLADEVTAECKDLQVLLHTELIAACGQDGAWEVDVMSRGQLMRIRAKALVDTSGDAVLTHLLQAPSMMENGGHLQRPAYIVKLAGVNAEASSETGRLRLAHGITRAVKEGDLPVECLGAGVRGGVNVGECFITIDLAAGGGDYDPLDAGLLTRMERLGRTTATHLQRWMKGNVEGFADSWIVAWPVRAGVRESRRMSGCYELTAEDVLKGRGFEDGIANIAWPIELREKATGPRWQFPEAGCAAQIPLAALRSQKYASLFAAGRCFSATHEALASVRVMGTCMATGEAAGMAAVHWDKGELEILHRIQQGRASF